MGSLFWGFFFPRKLGRLSYLARFIILFALCVWVISYTTPANRFWPWIIRVIFTLYFFACGMLPRARDCCLPKWLLFLLLVPGLNLIPVVILFFSPSRVAFVSDDGGETTTS